MPDTAQATGTIQEAANAFETLLSGPTGTEKPKDKQAPSPTEQVETTEAETQAAEETTSTEEVGEQEEAPADDEETPEETTDAPQLVTVTVNGKTEQLPVDEVAKGYQRQADYSRKTADLADQRRTLEGKEAEVKAAQDHYANLLQALGAQLTASQPKEPDWQKLRDSDPLEYFAQKDEWRDRQEKIAAVQFETARVQTIQAEQAQQALQTRLTESKTKLFETNPAWKDPKKWQSDRAAILEYGKTHAGYTEDELKNATDHRAVILLNKARMFDELMAKQPKPVIKKGPAPLTAGTTGTTQSRSNSETNKAKQRLAQTGRVADAAAVFERIL